MSSRTPTPNVMAALLGGAQTPPKSPTKSENASPASTDPTLTQPKPKAPAPKAQKPKAAATVSKPPLKTKPTRVTPVSRQTTKPEPKTIKSVLDSGQDKATFSMSQATLDRLEQIWFDLRRGKYGQRYRVSKSEIAEIAMEACLDDFEERLLDSHAGQILTARQTE